MQNIPIEQAMLAIQQAKLAMQQGLKKADQQQYTIVEKQLHQARKLLNDEIQKASANEVTLLEEANQTVEETITELHYSTNHPSNLQQG